MSKLSWTLLLTASMAGIAAFYPITKILDGAIDPFLLAFFRFSIAALVLLPFILYKGTLALPQKRDFPLFALVALCGVIATSLIFFGIERANSIVSAILVNTNPLMIALLSPFLISEYVTKSKRVGLIVGFIGVIVIVLNGHDPVTLFKSEYFWGSLILLAAAIFASINKIYSKGLVRMYDGLYVTFLATAFGAAMLSAVAVFNGAIPQVIDAAVSHPLALLTIGVVSTAIPWTIWSSSLKHLDVHVAASFSLLIPIFAALYSFIFLTEDFTLWMLFGMILTSAGIYIVQREEKIVVATA